MHGVEKSDPPVVAANPANKAAVAAAEPGERRGGTEENADPQSTVRTQSRAAVSQARARIRGAVTRNRKEKLTALLHHVDVDVLRAGFLSLRRAAAPGVDGMTWERYAEDLEADLADLHARVHAGAYMRAKPREIKERLRATHHDGAETQGRWLGQVLRGWLAYYAVPMSAPAITAFRQHHAIERWHHALRRRCQRRRLAWRRVRVLAERYLPFPRILHPWPEQRFLVTHP